MNNPGFLTVMATVYTTEGRCVEAESLLTRSMELDRAAGRSVSDTQLQLAGVWALEGRHDRATQGYSDVLAANPQSGDAWRGYIAALHNDFRCVAMDYPGYGMSDAPPGYGFTPKEHSMVLERFVDRLGLGDLTLMVQDWGGPIGLGFAGRRPELVRRLIVGNTFAWPLSGEWRIRLFSWVMGGPIGWSLTWAFNFVPKVFFARGLAQKTAPAVRAMYLAPWRDRARRGAAVIAPRQLIKASPTSERSKRTWRGWRTDQP